MSFRDLGIIELTVFAVLIVAFLLFFILFIILRHRKQAANTRKLLRKRALMEEAVQTKVRRAGEKGDRVRAQRIAVESAPGAFGEEFAKEADVYDETVSAAHTGQGHFTGGENSGRKEPLRMWDSNSKSVRTAKRSQQDLPFFVEERRISHRRDQLKRLEEAK